MSRKNWIRIIKGCIPVMKKSEPDPYFHKYSMHTELKTLVPLPTTFLEDLAAEWLRTVRRVKEEYDINIVVSGDTAFIETQKDGKK